MTCADGFRVKVGSIGMEMAYAQADAANDGLDQSYEDFRRWQSGGNDAIGISICIPF